MKKDENYVFVDQNEINTQKNGLEDFISQINSQLAKFYENGINMDIRTLFDVLESPSKIHELINNFAKKEAAKHKLKPMRDQIAEASEKLAGELENGVRKSLFPNSGYYININLLKTLKPYMSIAECKLVLSDGYMEILKGSYTYTADEQGKKVIDQLYLMRKTAIEYRELLKTLNIRDDRFKLDSAFYGGDRSTHLYIEDTTVFVDKIIKKRNKK